MENNVIINNKAPTDLLRSDFFYNLPEELIAQHPEAKGLWALCCL